MQRCEQCGFVYDALPVVDVASRLRSSPDRFRKALAGADPAASRRRPQPGVWSAVEYACHVRDVLLVQRDRAVRVQVEDRPDLPRMHRDERVELCGYGAHELQAVLNQLSTAAELCALVFELVDPDRWTRPLLHNWPETAEHDLAWLGRHTVHEVEHHLGDIGDVLQRVGR
jgi:hypothetical protein